MENNNITFFQMICAVVFGSMIFQWLNEIHSNEGLMAALKPLFWIGIILYFVIGLAIEMWKDMKQKRAWREADKKALDREKK